MRPLVPTVSVIIPAWNEERVIGTQLEAIARQVVQPHEVIVADNGSVDRTLEIVRTYEDRLPQLRCFVAAAVSGPSHARNEAAKVAIGDVLAFCDSDDEVDERWLAELIPALQTADVVGGVLDTERLNDDLAKSWRSVSTSTESADAQPAKAVTSNLAVWADTFHDVGMFDEEYVWAHDHEFSFRIQRAGYRLTHVPSAIVHYRFKPEIRSLARREYQDQVWVVKLYKEFRAQGYPRSDLPTVVKQWAWLVLHIGDLRRPEFRGRWIRKAAGCAGRLRGSVRFGVLFL